jgi:arylsulfate sulfotransferase
MSFERSCCLKGLISFKYFLVLFSLIFALSFFLISCDDNGNVLSSEIGPGDSSGDTSSDTTPPDFISDPVVTMAPNPDTPLAGLLEFTADEPVRAAVTISDTTLATTNSLNGSTREIEVEEDELTQDHSIMLLGFSPDKTYEIGLVVTDEAGNDTTLGQNISVTTDPLPEGFPPIEVTSTPELMEPGVTLFPVNGRGSNGGFNVLVAVNELGEVVWYHNPTGKNFTDVRRLSNGHILYIVPPDRTEMIEIDMLGNVIQKWNTPSSGDIDSNSVIVNTERFHHEVFEMENGNFLVLSVEIRLVDNYPTSDSDPEAPTETAAVAGDVVVEFTRDGTIVNEWHLLDMIDPYRIGYSSLITFWDFAFPEFENGTRDWTHGNAVIHDNIDDSIIVSLRHQDAVIKFSRQTGEIIWILGTHANWNPDTFGSFLLEPVGESFLWQYHQHAPQITSNNTIVLFDNGSYKAFPFEPTVPASENFSRAVEYLVNAETMQVEQVWEYEQFAEEIIYAPFVGDADSLPNTGNVLIDFGGIITDDSGMPSDSVGTGHCSIRIIEVTHTTPAEKVFDLSIDDNKSEFPGGWQSYRAERLPSLYP